MIPVRRVYVAADPERYVDLENDLGLSISVRNFPLRVRALRLVTLREPPYGEKRYRLDVVTAVAERDTGEPTTVTLSHELAACVVESYAADRREVLLDFVYNALRGVLLHELDEAWHVDGVRVKDPHKSERRG